MSRTAALYLILAALATLGLAPLGLLRAYHLQPLRAAPPALELQALNVPATPGAPIRAAVGSQAPDFRLPDVDGQSHSLTDYRGQVVLINFYATWCPPCQAEAKVLQGAYEKYRSQGFVIVAVDLQENPATVLRFGEKYSLAFPQLLDETGKVGRRYRVTGIPSSFLIDRQGQVLKVYTGPLSTRILDAWLSEALSAP